MQPLIDELYDLWVNGIKTWDATRILIFSFLFKAMRQVSLNIFAPIYSVEVELHDRKVCFAHLCYGLTRIVLSFLGNLRSNWVVIIGLELLSLACPGLDLGGVMLHHSTYVTLVTVMVILILLVC
jgi:hypothetical protein